MTTASTYDLELQALEEIIKLFLGFDEATRDRMMRYLLDRFGPEGKERRP